MDGAGLNGMTAADKRLIFRCPYCRRPMSNRYPSPANAPVQTPMKRKIKTKMIGAHKGTKQKWLTAKSTKKPKS